MEKLCFFEKHGFLGLELLKYLPTFSFDLAGLVGEYALELRQARILSFPWFREPSVYTKACSLLVRSNGEILFHNTQDLYTCTAEGKLLGSCSIESSKARAVFLDMTMDNQDNVYILMQCYESPGQCQFVHLKTEHSIKFLSFYSQQGYLTHLSWQCLDNSFLISTNWTFSIIRHEGEVLKTYHIMERSQMARRFAVSPERNVLFFDIAQSTVYRYALLDHLKIEKQTRLQGVTRDHFSGWVNRDTLFAVDFCKKRMALLDISMNKPISKVQIFREDGVLESVLDGCNEQVIRDFCFDVHGRLYLLMKKEVRVFED